MKTCDFQANIPGGFHGSTMVKRNNAAWHQAVPKQKKKMGRRGNRRAFVKINCNKEKGTPIPLGFFNLFFLSLFTRSLTAGHSIVAGGWKWKWGVLRFWF